MLPVASNEHCQAISPQTSGRFQSWTLSGVKVIEALKRLRRHLKIRALLEVWLYIHVPLTFALIVALSAHIVSVFFYW